MKYVYPAVFTLEPNGQYSINFPDFESCYTCGDSLEDGIMMAQDILAYTLYDEFEKKEIPVPSPSPFHNIPVTDNEFINYIACDTLEYAKRNSKKAVKKTLTIPEWLDFEATRQNINFSQLLQEAIKAKLKI